MRDLNYQLKLLCKHSHEGSFETRVDRERQIVIQARQSTTEHADVGKLSERSYTDIAADVLYVDGYNAT